MDYDEEANKINIQKLLDNIDLGGDDEINIDSDSTDSNVDL